MKLKYLVSIYIPLFILLLLPFFTEIISNAQSKSSSHKTKVTKHHSTKRHVEHQLEVNEREIEDLDFPALRAQQFFNQRAFPFSTFPIDWRVKALTHIEKENKSKITSKATNGFNPIGPIPIANGQTFGDRDKVSGRVSSLAINPQNPNIVFLGAAQGGVWRSTDAGNTWQPMTDNAPTQAIGAIAIDPSDPKTIYAGTGEGNLSGDSFFGMGVLKSTDSGDTWSTLATQTFLGLAFNRIIVDPNNKNVLYASVARGIAGGRSRNPLTGDPGIYKSTDAGVTWNPSLRDGDPVFFDGLDVEMDPTNSSKLFGSIRNLGVYLTTDAGKSWSPVGGGLPTTDILRVDIGIAPSDPNFVYVSAGSASSGDLNGIYKSTDAGKSWQQVNFPPRSAFGNICQCFYDNTIVVDPTDPKVVYFGGVALYRSTDAGMSWIDISAAQSMHADFHAVAINVSAQGKQIYAGNDGGVWGSINGGQDWNNLNATLNITQFQNIALHPTNPSITLGGTQDNGTNLYQGNPTWAHSDDGDGGFTAIDQNNPDVMYHTYFNLTGLQILIVRSDQGGRLGTWARMGQGLNINDDVLFYAPFILDPNKQSTVYFGTSRLYRSLDQSKTFQPISGKLTKGTIRAAISAIAVAQNKPNIIYTGSSDGGVFASQDNGATFQDVTDNLPARFITDIVVDPVVSTTVYVSLGGFQAGQVFKSTTGGKNWKNISNNLPDVPATALIINPNNSRNLFLGTDVGVFQTNDGGSSWQLVPGIPVVSIFDLAINVKLGILRAATHGRGVYELKLSNNTDTTSPTITVTQPNGGEAITANSQFSIKWVSNDDVGVMKHQIELSTDGGNSFPISIASGLDGTVQEFLWNVPIIITDQARIRITAIDAAGNSTSDVSDSNFSIQMSTQADFGLDFGFTILTAKRGEMVKAQARIVRTGGFADQVTVTPDPNILTTLKIKTKPPSISTTGAIVEFSLKVKKAAPLGKQLLTFIGKDSQGRTRTGVLMLTVQ